NQGRRTRLPPLRKLSYQNPLLLRQTRHGSRRPFARYPHDSVKSEIWASLVELKRTTVSLRPVFDWVDPTETESERKKKRLERFGESYQKTADLCEKNRPFYPAQIWTELKKLLETAYKEAVAYRHKREDRDWEKYWEEAEAAQK